MLQEESGAGVGRTREVLALTVSVTSLIGVIVLAGVMIHAAKGDFEDIQHVMATILPLVGTWVGTVLAFYFSKENFEAAARSVSEIAKQLPASARPLSDLNVKDKMIPVGQMFLKTLPISALKITEVLKELTDNNKGDRLPVVTDTRVAKYIIHRSMLERYLADKASDPQAVSNIAALTFQNLFTDQPSLERLFATSFGVVGPTQNLADVQKTMTQTKNCEDVFVTAGGGADDEVIGWITDNIVQQNLKP